MIGSPRRAAFVARQDRIGRAGRSARLALSLLAFAAPLAAQIARPQKARLALQPDSESIVAGAEARLDALVTIDPGWHVQAHLPTYDYLIPTVLEVELPPGFEPARVDYPAPIRYRFTFAEEELDVYEGSLVLSINLRLPAGTPPGPLPVAATLRYQACDDKSCLPPVTTRATVELTVAASAPRAARVEASATAPAPSPAPPLELTLDSSPRAAQPATKASAAAPTRSGRSLFAVLLFALLGGVILNGMPCVLPIVSLKLFGLVKSSGASRRAVRTGALATTAGILFSFWALAAAAIAARAAGAAIGWGVQFQQPGFVAFLAVVVLLFSLNLWGLFEIFLPARLAQLADAGASSEGLGGQFASGLFATLMATPCSAPFLGTALSFALGQSAATIVAVLTAVGVGLALPYLLLIVAPGLVRYLPKPGQWMDTLRGAMGFLLAGALVWLFYVLAAQIAAERLAFFQLALLAISLALFFTHRAPAGSARRPIGWAVALLLAAAAVVLVQGAPRASTRRPVVDSDRATIDWVAFDRTEAERLAASGRLVFLDVTADWCVTCKVNERVVLSAPEVVAAFRQYEVVAMKADWTNRDDAITRLLAEHGRYGIPFYMLYRPGRAPHLFGELISKQGIIDVFAASGS